MIRKKKFDLNLLQYPQMNSSHKFTDVLDQKNNISNPNTDSKPINILSSIDIFNILVWKLTFENKSFSLLSSDFGYKNISTCNFKRFLQALKPCFQSYFINYLRKYYKFLFENKSKIYDFRLQGILPLMLRNNKYYLSIVCIIPIINNHKLEGFYFTLTPLKKYQDEFPTFSILNNRKKDKLMTNQINTNVTIDDLLTKKQSGVFELILMGYTSTKIAIHLGIKKETVFSYNIRIKEKMTAFFEIDFETVIDAAKYYKNCFIVK